MILSSIQYIYIPASNITTQLLVFCCDTALESDFLTIFSQDTWTTTQMHDEKPMLDLPIDSYFLSVKVGAAHYAIEQSELPMGIPWSDSIMSLHK